MIVYFVYLIGHRVPKINILSEPVCEVFSDELVDLVNFLLQWEWALSNFLKAWVEQEAEEREICLFCFLPAWLNGEISFPLLWPLDWNLSHWCFLLLSAFPSFLHFYWVILLIYKISCSNISITKNFFQILACILTVNCVFWWKLLFLLRFINILFIVVTF